MPLHFFGSQFKMTPKVVARERPAAAKKKND